MADRRSSKRHRDSLLHVDGAGVNKIKKQIRNIERLLSKKRDVLPQTVLMEKERMLEALRLEFSAAEKRAIARENASKYHMVRFFERKKALRRYRQALKLQQEDPSNDGLKKDLYQREIELCYVVNFPKTVKYIALYPSADDGSSVCDQRKVYLDKVAKQLHEGTLPVPLEDILKGKKLGRDNLGLDDDEGEMDDQDEFRYPAGRDSSETNGIAKDDSGEDDDEDFFE